MRSTSRDRDGLIRFAGRFNGVTAKILWNGEIPWVISRTGVGIYKVMFDSTFIALSVMASQDGGIAIPYSLIAGGFSINTIAAGGALTDESNIYFEAVCRKLSVS